MTKHFCDKCGVDTLDNYVRVSFSGSTSEKGVLFKNVTFCEKCYMKVDKVLEKSLATSGQKKKP